MGFKKDKNNHSKKRWFLYLILAGSIVKLFGFLFRKRDDIGDNFKDFVEKEEKEVKELVNGQESFKRFCRDSGSIFKDFFIPHQGNDHKPKILHAKSLAIIVIILVALKIFVTGYLFFIYPNQARMHEQIVSEVLKLINQDRIHNNLSALVINPALNAAALGRAEDMVERNYFAHYGPDGKKPWDWINRDKYVYLFVGENLAMNFSSAKSAHNALMQSPTHKKNILNSRYSDIGLAVISGEINGQTTDVLVQLFATEQAPALALADVSDSTDGTTEKKAEEFDNNKTKVLATESHKLAQNKEPAAALKKEGKPKALEKQTKKEQDTDKKLDAQPSQSKVIMHEEPKKITTAGDGQKIIKESIVSPNMELEENPNIKLRYYSPNNDKRIGIAAKLIKGSKYIYIGFLGLMIIALIINIVVRITVQHKPIIIQTLLVIFFIAGLVSLRLHILENVLGKVAVL